MVAALICLGSLSLLAQSDSGLQELTLSEEVWREVVPRILKDKFQPAKDPQTVELYDEGLRWEWLPAIENVSFVLLPKTEIELRKLKVYFFRTKARRESNGRIEVDFGFGDLFCNNSGSTWTYRESKGPSTLKRSSGGWGTGCGSGDGTGH